MQPDQRQEPDSSSGFRHNEPVRWVRLHQLASIDRPAMRGIGGIV